MVNGSLGNTAVTVNSAGTLSGTGMIGGTVAVNGTISPDNTPAPCVLTFTATPVPKLGTLCGWSTIGLCVGIFTLRRRRWQAA